MESLDWKFWVGDVGIPIVTFIIGLFTGKAIERKAKAKVKGDNNMIIQNSSVGRRKR